MAVSVSIPSRAIWSLFTRFSSTSLLLVVCTTSVISQMSFWRTASANGRSYSTGPKRASLSIEKFGRSVFFAVLWTFADQICGVAVM